MSDNPPAAPPPEPAAPPPAPPEPAAPPAKPPKSDLSRFGAPVKLNANGSVTCRACGLEITFLPETFPAEELPDGAPRTVNHTGCSQAKAGESPAGADAERGFHETINVIDQDEVAEFYKDKAAFAKARGG
jgi:hypothetical protein